MGEERTRFTRELFLLWEYKSQDTIDFKMVYVDMSGDLLAGLLLSQIVYWHLPNKQGRTKLRVRRDGQLWIAKADKDWWTEIRLKEAQARRARLILSKAKLIVTATYRFAGTPKTHIHLNWSVFLDRLESEIKSTCEEDQDILDLIASEPVLEPETCTESTTENTNNDVVGALRGIGVLESTARELAALRDKDTIEGWIDYALVHASQLYNPAGFVVAQLQKGLPVPTIEQAYEDLMRKCTICHRLRWDVVDGVCDECAD